MDVEEDLFSTDSLFYTDGVEPGRAHGNCVEKLLASRRKQVPSDPYAPFVEIVERLHARVSSGEGSIVVLHRPV